MRALFYLGLLGLVLFEILKVYFIMPMPGSQRLDSLDVAYALHVYRWVFRGASVLLIVMGSRRAWAARPRWLPAVAVVAAAAVVGVFNFKLTAERMFQPPATLTFAAKTDNTLDADSMVLGVTLGGQAKAYPLRYLVYHHQVQDIVGGQPVLVTYCSVCRTGRVFAPVVAGRTETFRLVGMDHFNAMFEDATTRSWWRQATGEAVTGPLKGSALPVVASAQLTLRQWFELHPDGLVMQPEAASSARYDTEGRFERGESTGDLTRTDRASWQDKSWVVGLAIGEASKAYDWNRLVERRLIHDQLGGTPLVLVLATDGQSFAAFERPSAAAEFTLAGDLLSSGGQSYDLSGRAVAASAPGLRPLAAYQEFWHSWRTFHPGTEQDR